MIQLTLPAASAAPESFVTRLSKGELVSPTDSRFVSTDAGSSLWCGEHGLFEIENNEEHIGGDVVLIDPKAGRADRLIRARSIHNTLLVTEQCDQLCVMCSQPPKKTHEDRFDFFEEACLLAPEGQTIGISGGEPMLHSDRLLQMVERVLLSRQDLQFHILTNAQHFRKDHINRFRNSIYKRVVWGIPIYSSDPPVHDSIVAKPGAFEILLASFENLLVSGARIELRTVLTKTTVDGLDELSRFVAHNLQYIEQWSLMGLENIGFARNRWDDLHFDITAGFEQIGQAIDRSTLFGIATRLFNIPLCHIPVEFRSFAIASISDWKQRFGAACDQCSAKPDCSGFFEWHPDELVDGVTPL